MENASQGKGLLDVLVETGKLTTEQAQSIEEEHNRTAVPVHTIIAQRKLVEEEVVVRARGTQMGIPYIDLVGREISVDALNAIPRTAAESARAIPFEITQHEIHVGMVEPRDPQAVQAVEFVVRSHDLSPKYFIISQGSFLSAIKRYAAIGKEVERALEFAKEKLEEVKEEKETKGESIEEVIKGAPVSRIVSVVFRHAVESGASDIHIEPFGEETRVRYRIDGTLRTALTLPKYVHASIVSRIKVLANLKLDETRIPQDGRITEKFGTKIIDFRVSTLPLPDTEKVVLRVLDTSKGVPSLEQLGFRKEYVDIIKSEIRKPHGMFLISGPTGSGKSTTLFTVLNMRNEEKVNISTLEDPVEYEIKGVNQAQIRPEVGFTFAAGLRALLRQDPNVIMVGEIRDGETGELAVHAALTGHLIFSTLHTNDAFGVVPRLIDMNIEPFLLGATLNLAIAQRLARKICERCKTEVPAVPEVDAAIRRELAKIPAAYMEGRALSTPITLYKGRGCLRCGDTGYNGRVACAELVMFTEAMRDLVVRGFPIEQVRELSIKQNMLSLKQDGILKALEGFTTLEEVFRITAE